MLSDAECRQSPMITANPSVRVAKEGHCVQLHSAFAVDPLHKIVYRLITVQRDINCNASR